LIGMKRACVMNSERVLCRADETLYTAAFVANGLHDGIRAYLPCLAVNISLGGQTIAGVLINDIRPKRDCWLTIYSTSERWATRRVMRYVFGIVFKMIEAERCSVFVSADNNKSLNMCLRLGFKQEGLLRQFRDDGKDCIALGMLKNECKWV